MTDANKPKKPAKAAGAPAGKSQQRARKTTKPAKKGRAESSIEKAADALTAAAQKYADAIVDQVGARIGELIDGARRQYRSEMAEIASHQEKSSKDMPDKFRPDYLETARACREIAFTLRYSSEKGITEDSPMWAMLVLMYQQTANLLIEIVGQYVAEGSKDCSAEQFGDLLRLTLGSADTQPYSASNAKVREYMKGARTRPKTFLAAQEILLEKHMTSVAKSIATAAGLMPRQRAVKGSKYDEASEDEAQLVASGKYKLGSARLIDLLCRRYIDGYTGMGPDEKKTVKKQMREGLRERRSKKAQKVKTLKQR